MAALMGEPASPSLRALFIECHDRPDPGEPPSPDAGDSPAAQALADAQVEAADSRSCPIEPSFVAGEVGRVQSGRAMSPRRASMTSVATTPRAAPHSRPASTGVSSAAGLLRRDDLLAALDRASLKKVTVISAPPGSGKTSLLRAWSDRASKDRRVAFVSVPPDQQDAQQFWLAVLDAIRQTDAIADSRRQAAAPDL